MLKKIASLFFLTFSFVSVSNPSHALDLGIPVECKYGKDCFIRDYFDHDPEEGFLDHKCGMLSKDGHKSTDFVLRSYNQMKKGVFVLAAENGTVRNIRDGMSDIPSKLMGLEAIRGKECGNGIIIEHKRNYITQYCHLMKESILVKPGEKIKKGTQIAKVGLSGYTDFPYLQFTVQKDGQALDPFTGEDPDNGEAITQCGIEDIYPLWDRHVEKELKYIPTALLNTGFSSRVPNADKARSGSLKKRKFTNDSKLLAFWADIMGVLPGDTVKMTISNPDGELIVDESRSFNEIKSQHFRFVAKKLKGPAWKNGIYTGTTILLRKKDGEILPIINASIDATIE